MPIRVPFQTGISFSCQASLQWSCLVLASTHIPLLSTKIKDELKYHRIWVFPAITSFQSRRQLLQLTMTWLLRPLQLFSHRALDTD
jgi:glutamate racemase